MYGQNDKINIEMMGMSLKFIDSVNLKILDFVDVKTRVYRGVVYTRARRPQP
jgi:hypothetical protein